jgi:peptide deformylase
MPPVIDLSELPPGRLRQVVRAPARVLSVATAEVDPTTPEVVQLAADLIATMDAARGCVGLAAPQVGVSWRVFCVDVTGHRKTRTCNGRFVLVNPKLVEASRWEKAREGCLSVPDLTGDVKRATRVVVSGVSPGSGADVVVRTDGFEARALQHELDHVDGLVFLDRVAGAHAVFARKVYL